MYSLRGKAAIISDLHLGSVTCLHHQIQHFLKIVHSGEYSLLVIAGDLLESTTRNRLESRDWKVLSKIRKMSNDIDIVWVSGNHDAYHPEVIASILGARFVGEDFKIVTKNNTIICVHGHQFDKYIAKHPWLTFVLGWLYLLVQRIDRRHRIAHTVKRWTKNLSACAPRVKHGACEVYCDKKNNIVVCGHTHKAEIDLPAQYVNTGSWTELRGNYVIIDEDGNVEFKIWQEHLEEGSS